MVTNPPSKSATESGPFREQREPGYWLLTAAAAPLVAFSTRPGGASGGPYASLNLGLSTADRPENVLENRRRLTRALGVEHVALLHQVHGAAVRSVSRAGLAGEGDVLATTTPDLALAVGTADCLGVVLWDEPRTALAVAHAGWRGLLAGAVEAALDWLARERPGARLRAALGPALGACCFEVGPEVAERFPPEHVRPGGVRPHLDLARAVKDRLATRGLAREAVLDLGLCTSCDPDRFYSHRRDAGVTGRHWALARLAPARPQGSGP